MKPDIKLMATIITAMEMAMAMMAMRMMKEENDPLVPKAMRRAIYPSIFKYCIFAEIKSNSFLETYNNRPAQFCFFYNPGIRMSSYMVAI